MVSDVGLLYEWFEWFSSTCTFPCTNVNFVKKKRKRKKKVHFNEPNLHRFVCERFVKTANSGLCCSLTATRSWMWPAAFLGGVCIFSLCLQGFSLGFLASTYIQKHWCRVMWKLWFAYRRICEFNWLFVFMLPSNELVICPGCHFAFALCQERLKRTPIFLNSGNSGFSSGLMDGWVWILAPNLLVARLVEFFFSSSALKTPAITFALLI